MRFSHLIKPAALFFVATMLAGTQVAASAYAQQPPAMGPADSLPGVTMPQGDTAPAQSLPPPQDRSQPPAQAENKSPERKIDDLLAALRRESDPDKAKGIATELQSDWSVSGSATVDLLMQWAATAVEEKRNGAALDFLDRATLLAPDFADAWNQRATLHYTMGDRRKAMSDINEVLKREPRHFGAIAGMTTILLETDQDGLAQKALERYLAIYPADKEAREQMEKLAEKLAGSRI